MAKGPLFGKGPVRHPRRVPAVYGGAYFHEFVTEMPRSQELLEALDRREFWAACR